MDFITLWKASSILLTGSFGILGLIKESKDKTTGQITRWGRVSLAGILLSTSLGVVAQLKESSQQQKASETTAKETLALARKTDQTVRDLERVLSSLDEPTVDVEFYFRCSDPQYASICAQEQTGSGLSDSKFWLKWLGGEEIDFDADLAFFRDAAAASSFLAGNDSDPDLQVEVTARNYGERTNLALMRVEQGIPGSSLDPANERLWVKLEGCIPTIFRNNGKIASLSDLAGTTVLLFPQIGVTTPKYDDFQRVSNNQRLQGLECSGIRIITKKGQSAGLYKFDRVTMNNDLVCRGVFQAE